MVYYDWEQSVATNRWVDLRKTSSFGRIPVASGAKSETVVSELSCDDVSPVHS